jgi:xanthine dehydrogenase YagS FAD-binding subunit
MKPFQYVTAASAASAVKLVVDRGHYLSGGVDLLGEMKEYIAQPRTLVNVKAIPGLDKIEPGEKVWSIGANVTVAELEHHAGLKRVFPGLQQAAAEVASPQIRNAATLGGNLAQHSRCWYYRHRDVHCLKKGGDTCYARNGDNRYHSLFTGNTCISPAVSNLAVVLGALDATALVQRGQQILRLSIQELYQKAWDNPTAHHSLEHGDLVLKAEIPVLRTRSAYQQISDKALFDWALASCAVAARMDGKTLRQARVVLGAVGNVPHQVQAANDYMEGKTLEEPLAEKVAELLLEDAKPLEGNAYKLPLAKALVRRTLMRLAEPV